MKFLIILLFPAVLFAQSDLDEGMDKAFMNAKKGVYWALENIPDSKSTLRSDLIDGDTLVAEVKLYKETKGVKVESTGFNGSYSAEVIVYRSYDLIYREKYKQEE